MSEPVSERVVEQRLRNRIMEAVLGLTLGDAEVWAHGASEYFNSFYDEIPHHAHGGLHPNSALNADERAALLLVRQIVDEACDATPREMTADELIATGWPGRIQPVAQAALELMMQRGRFRADVEEDEPSANDGWVDWVRKGG